MTIVGAGVIGLEYASIFATLGVRVTVIDKAPQLLPSIDREIMEALVYQLRLMRVTLRLGEEVSDIAPVDDARGGTSRDPSGKRKTDRYRESAIQHRPYGCDEGVASRSGGPRGRRLRAHQGQIDVSDRGRSHLRCGRRDRLPQPRLDLLRARQARSLSRAGH